MTSHIDADQPTTIELVRQRDGDTTWLRHRGRAAELDRRLLDGATESELVEVRPSWKGHVKHLRDVHGVLVVEEPAGFWQIVGADASQRRASNAVEEVGALGNDDDYGDGDGNAPALQSSPVSADDSLRLRETAKALAALAQVDLLGNELLKASVSMLVRQASESRHWHACAHYRSRDAAAMIRKANITSLAHYQAFCSQKLRHEHVVPVSVIYKMLCEAEDTSVEGLVGLLQKFSLRATITRDEDKELSQNGLAYKMPDAFYVKGSNLHNQPMAR